MYRFFLIFIDMIPSVIYLAPLFLLIFRKVARKRKWLMIVFASYLAAVFSTVGLPYAFTFFRQPFPWEPNLNLIPFLDVLHDAGPFLKNFSLNILLFVPLGFLLPLLWNGQVSTLKKALCYGLAFSCFIELAQLFTFRMTDVDDLIANTAGALLGFLLYKKLLTRQSMGQGEKEHAAAATDTSPDAALTAPVPTAAKKEMTVIFLVTLAVYMTLQPVTSAFLWDLLL